MAGMAATIFAANRGIDVLQVGVTAEINFASGLIDLLGVHPVEAGRVRKCPWKAIAELVRETPAHPFARLTSTQIEQAMAEFLSFLKDAGQPYVVSPEHNVRVLTPLGTTKTTYAVPQSMAAGIDAMAEGSPCLLVDFKGLKGFSARQIVETIGGRWPALRRARVAFPKLEGELYPEKMAWALENEAARRQLIGHLRPQLGDAVYVGFPAVLGIYRTAEVIDHLQDALGVRIFEIPTMLPAVTGLRLREAIEQRLRKIGVRTRYQQTVTAVEVPADRSLRLTLGGDGRATVVRSRAVVLATGRFYGKGLQADRKNVRESLFDMPVYQPADRSLWHRRDLLNPAGHPINLAGLQVDDRFRPVDAHGRAVYPTVFAAGSVLAHQDWTRQKCGSGLAIATAYGAVGGYCRTKA
jgi:glycerol-3-phosphate dehydrogenase subunit B